MQNSPRSRLTFIVGIILVIISALVIGFIAVSAQQKGDVLVPKAQISAYELINPATDLKTVSLAKSAINDNTLTPEKLDQLKKEGKLATDPTDKSVRLVSLSTLLSDDPIDIRNINKDANTALSIVSPDEVLVGVTSDTAGSVAGLVGPGSVVDVSENGATVADYAKVVCAGTGSNACDAVFLRQTKTAGGKNGDVFAVLSVPKTIAGTISGQQVQFALNPACLVDANGHIYAQPGREAACVPPADRAASKAATKAPAAKTPVPAVTTPATTPTPTTPTATTPTP